MACSAPQNAHTTRARWPERRFQALTPGENVPSPASISPFSAKVTERFWPGSDSEPALQAVPRHPLGAENALSRPFSRPTFAGPRSSPDTRCRGRPQQSPDRRQGRPQIGPNESRALAGPTDDPPSRSGGTSVAGQQCPRFHPPGRQAVHHPGGRLLDVVPTVQRVASRLLHIPIPGTRRWTF